MKKTVVIFLILVVVSGWGFHSYAQSVPVKLGLKVSPCLSWMASQTKGYSYDGITAGAAIGLVSDFYFAEHYAFSTGFNFSFLNGKLSYADSLVLIGGGIVGERERKYKLIYLDIPYMLKMKTNTFGKFAFFGQIGFSTGFRMVAKAADVLTPEGGGESWKENSNINSETTLIRQAVLFGLGLEYSLDDNTRIFVGASYSNCLNNILKGKNAASSLTEKGHLNYAELNIGVLF
jgi:hypothetical protein